MSLPYIEGQIIGVPYHSPSQNPPVVFLNDIDAPSTTFPAGQWVTVEVPDIPEDTKAVSLVGVMMITSGSLQVAGDFPQQQPNMTLRVRRWVGPTIPYSPDYVGQVVEARFGGVRTNFSSWCAVENRKFEIFWTRNTPYPHPGYAAYGLKIYIDAYMR